MEPTAITLFLLSVSLVLYVLLGYPLLLGVVARRRARPVRKRNQELSVSIILPVRDGEPWIRAKLNSLLALDYPSNLLEIFVISDGSVDGTDDIVREYAFAGVQLIRIRRGGKPAALNAGMIRATGEILFFTDVRQLLGSECLRRLVNGFSDSQVGVVSGELVLRDGVDSTQAKVSLYWRYETWIRSHLSEIDSVLGASGCVYAMRRELAVPLPKQTLLDDVYLPLAALFKGYRVIIERAARAYDSPVGLQSEFLRKVRTLAGVYQILREYPELLGSRNRMRIHFLSHKIGRLVLPHALIIMAVTGWWLPAAWRDGAVVAQAIFYAFCALDPWIPEEWLVKPVTSASRAFLVMMAAAFCAGPAFLFGGNLWIDTRARPSVQKVHVELQ